MGNFVCKPSNTDHHQEVNAGGKVQPFSSCKKNHKIIKQTWKKISGNKIENGVLVFYKLFQIIPEARQYFTSVEFFESIKDLMKDPLVRSHGLRFIKAIETMLEIEFDPNGCTFLFNAIGNRHCNYGIKPDYLDHVPEAFRFMLTKALGNNYSDKIADIWDEILWHIINVMKAKMLEGITLEQARKELARHKISAKATDASTKPNEDISDSTINVNKDCIND